jgi:hypothetical protein
MRTILVAMALGCAAGCGSGGVEPPTAPRNCQYSISPVQFDICVADRFERSLTVDTQTGCSWTASASVSWITLASGQTGTGPGTVRFSAADNFDAPRDGLVVVHAPRGGLVVMRSPTSQQQGARVSQAGCLYWVSKSSFSFGSAGGPGEFEALTMTLPSQCGGPLQDACVWTAQADVSWISIITPMPAHGDNRLQFNVAPNGSSAPRAGTITIADKVVQITQAGR